MCVHVINPVKFLHYFLSNNCLCAYYTFWNVYIIFYPITVITFITFQKVFKKALELRYHPIRHFTSDINHNAPCLRPPHPQKFAQPLYSLGTIVISCHSINYLSLREHKLYLRDCAMQLFHVFIWHNVTARCRRYVSPQMYRSSLEFAVAHWLEHPASVVEGSGFNSHLQLKFFFLSPLSTHIILFIIYCLESNYVTARCSYSVCLFDIMWLRLTCLSREFSVAQWL